MGTRVELYEAIRRDHRREDLSIRALAERHGVHRRTVRAALASAVPPPRKTPVRVAPKLEVAKPLIDAMLREDLGVWHKQQHTARRVLARLVDEHGMTTLTYSGVRDYVARRRPEIQAEAGKTVERAFVPQTHEPGAEAEVDFADVWLRLDGELTRCFLFTLRLSYSGKAVHRVFASQGQEAFIEGHLEAFRVLGGTPAEKIRYDNLKSAVSRVLFGRNRTESDRWVAFRSHYGFDTFYCLPGVEGAHEKGGVEGEVGRFRRNHLVPMPDVATLAELNAHLEQVDAAEDRRRIDNRTLTVGHDFALEQGLLRPLPAEGIDPGLTLTPRVDRYARVIVRQAHYSVPARLIGRRVKVSLRASELVVFDGRTEVARHPRSVRKGSQSCCWITTWRCWPASPAPCRVPPCWRRPGAPGRSPRRMTRSGRWLAKPLVTPGAPGLWSRCCCCTVTSRTATSWPAWRPRCRSARPARTSWRSRPARPRSSAAPARPSPAGRPAAPAR